MTAPEPASQPVELSLVATPPVEVPSPAEAAPQSLQRRVLGLAWPVIGENLLQTLLGVVDTILEGGLGAVARAGVGPALKVRFVIIAALSALSVGAAVLVAQAFGAGDLAAASRFARQALLWSAIVSVPLALVGLYLTPAIVSLFGLQDEVAQLASGYLHITIGTIVTLTTVLIGGGVLRGIGDSRTPMLITALSNLINIALAYALIYGHLGMPALGAVGSAWATFLARLTGALLLLGVLWRGRNGVSISGHGTWRPQPGVAGQVLRIGLPAALEEVLIIGAFATLTPIVAGLGTVALAAQRVVINALSLSFLPGIGFGLAATALVGQAVGARRLDEAHAITRIALRWAIVWMGALGVGFLLFAPQIMWIFTSDQQMIAIGAAALRVVALTQPLWAASFVYAGVLRGTGNTRAPLLITGIAVWAVVGLGYLMLVLVQQSLAALWAAFLLTGPIETFCFWWVWRRWRRRNESRIEDRG
jgi:putative MATE family efflux protein